MNALAALTLNGFREARRNRVTTVVIVFALIMIFSSTVSMSLTVATFDRVMTDLGLGVMTLISAFLTIFLASGLVPREIERRTIFMVLAKPLHRNTFIVGRYLGNLLTVWTLTAAMAVLLLLQLIINNTEIHITHGAAVLGLCLQSMVLSAVAFLFASFSSQFVTAITSISLYSLGHLTPELYAMADRSKSEALRVIGKVLYYVLPNLDRMSFTSRATYNDPIALSELTSAAVYGVGYSVVMLVMACALFSRRDFK